MRLGVLSMFGLSETGVNGGEGCHVSCDRISRAACSLPQERCGDGGVVLSDAREADPG